LTRKSQKAREEKFLHHFKDLFKQFPEGKIEASETPDFIVNLEGGAKLGIELVELFPNTTLEEKAHLKLTKIESEIVKFAKQEFESSFGINLMISLSFDSNLRCSKSNRKRFAKSVSDDVYKCYCSITNEKVSFRIFDKSYLKTQYLDRVFIHTKKIQNGLWDSGHGAELRDLQYHELSSMIVSKEEGLSRIRLRVKDAWLLVIEPHDMLNFDDIDLFEVIDTQFDKVFLLRVILDEIVEVK
jgi:hypothetical protein